MSSYLPMNAASVKGTSVVEVDNVCERSAIMESNGKLIRRKDTCDGAGVTVALAINDPIISWE